MIADVVICAIGLAVAAVGFALGLHAYITARRALDDVRRLAGVLLEDVPGPGEPSEGSMGGSS